MTTSATNCFPSLTRLRGLAFHVFLDSNQGKEFCLQLMKRFSISVLEVSEGLPKPKYSRTAEGAKNDGEGIELPVAAEVMER